MIYKKQQDKNPFFDKEFAYDLMIETVEDEEHRYRFSSGYYDELDYFKKYLQQIEGSQMKSTNWAIVDDIYDLSNGVELPLWKTSSDRISELLSK